MPAPVAAVARAIAVGEGALSGSTNTNDVLPARHAIPMIVPSNRRSRAPFA